MRRHYLFLSVPLFILAACSGKEEASEGSNVQNDVAVEAPAEAAAVAEAAADAARAAASEAGSPPKIGPEAAPNLAFEYRYAFKLPDKQIGAVQQEHAEACAVLGNARCQIVDMKFEQQEDDVQAMLAFKLDPSIAFKFGRDAIASVEKAEGVLADGNISGNDVGGEIQDSQGRSALLQGQLERLEKRLAAKGLASKERASLQDRAEELRKELDGEQAGRVTGEAKLAMTPVQFTYTSDGGLPGFGKDNPFANAFDVTANSFAAMISFVLLVLGAAAPWLVLVAALVWFFRSRVGRTIRGWWSKGPATPSTPDAAA